MFDPCFGCMPLEQGVKYSAIGKIVIEVLAILYYGLWLLLYMVGSAILASLGAGLGGGGSFSYEVWMIFYYVQLGSYALGVIGFIAMLVLDVLLILSVAKRNLRLSKIWIIVNMVLIILLFVFTCFSFLSGAYFGVLSIFAFMYFIYVIFVVYAFMQKLKREQLGGTPAFGAVQPAPVYGQPSQHTRAPPSRQAPPSYRSSKNSVRNNP